MSSWFDVCSVETESESESEFDAVPRGGTVSSPDMERNLIQMELPWVNVQRTFANGLAVRGSECIPVGMLCEAMLIAASTAGHACLHDLRLRLDEPPTGGDLNIRFDRCLGWIQVELQGADARDSGTRIVATSAAGAGSATRQIDPASVRDLRPTQTGDAFYDHLERAGIVVGGSSRRILRVRRARGTVIAELSDASIEVARYTVDPTAMDAALHYALALLVPPGELAEAAGLHVERATVYLRGREVTAVHVCGPVGERLDIVLLDEAGHSVAELQGVGRQRSERTRVPGVGTTDSVLDLCRLVAERSELEWDTNLAEAGISSLVLLQMLEAIHAFLRLRPTFNHSDTRRTLRQIADRWEFCNDDIADPWESRREAPATLAQLGMWRQSRSGNSGAVFNEFVVYAVRGPLDFEILKGAFDRLVRQHDALRCVFEMKAGGLVQKTVDRPELELVDIEVSAGRDPLEVARDLAQREFDMQEGPLVRAAALTSEPGLIGYLVLVAHHAIVDEWSARLIVERYLPAAYRVQSGRAATPEALARTSPAQWAQREQTALLNGQWADDLAWLRRQRRESPGVRDLPWRHEGHDRSAGRGSGAAEIRWSAATSEQIRTLARRARCTTFEVLFALWQASLARYASASCVTVGVPAANRNDVDSLAVVGLFTNVLPVAAEVRLEASVLDWITESRARLHEYLARQHIPAAGLASGERDASRIDVLFVATEAREPIWLGAAELTHVPLPGRSERFPLTMQVAASDAAELTGILRYDRDLLDDSVAWLADAFERLVENASRDPFLPIGSVELLGTRARERVRRAMLSHDTAFDDADVFRLFAHQAAGRVMQPAVVWRDGTLGYAALYGLACTVAGELERRGIGSGDRVALCLDRSGEAIAVLLGVIAAGAAYVPLDPAWPRRRIEFVCKDAAVSLLVGRDAAVDVEACEFVEARRLLQSGASARWSPEGRGPAPDDPAYVMYTSGSTGDPKGVVLPHRALSSLVEWARHVHKADELGGVLASSPFAFDMSTFEVFVPLALGGTIVLVSSVLDLPWPSSVVPVTLVNTVPTALRQLVKAGGIPESVLCINSAGERLSGVLVEQLHESTSVRCVNDVYGPTETNCVTAGRRSQNDEEHVGLPLPNARILIVDGSLRPLPPGAVGEVLIGGPSVALGYTGANGEAAFLNGARFGITGTVYRSGDLGRCLADGRLQLLGRRDRQLKIRGYRIEPESIEAELAKQEGVVDCAVIPNRARDRLIAFVVEVDDANRLSAQERRRRLKEVLPAFSVPDEFQAIERIPRTSSGKMDRSALLERLEHERLAEVERSDGLIGLLQDLWGTATGCGTPNPESDLVAFGIDSLAVVEFVQLCNASGVAMTIDEVFDASSLADLAARIGSVNASSRDASLLIQRDIESCRHVDVAAAPVGRDAPSRVVLSGATGFLGSSVLERLVAQQGIEQVCCVVRASSETEGRERLERVLRQYRIALSKDEWAKVSVIVGDLAQGKLALRDASAAASIAREAAIYHIGADVRFGPTYAALRGANVLGTAEVLKLAARAGAEVHFVSTLGVAGYARAEVAHVPDLLPMGYLQTKWAAERLAEQAHQAGVRVRIWRPGRITSDSRSGAVSTGDALVRAIIDIVALGSVFEPRDLILDDLMSVDDVASTLVTRSRSGADDGRPVNMRGDELAMATLIEWLRGLGFDVQEEPFEQWRRRIAAASGVSRLAPVAHVLGAGSVPNLWNVRGADHDALELSVGRGDANSRESFSRMIEFLVSTSCLPSPQPGNADNIDQLDSP